MQGIQGRGTGRIQRKTGPVEIVDIGDAVGDNGEIGARHAVGGGGTDIVGVNSATVRRGCPDKDGCIGIRERTRDNIGVFQSFPDKLKQKTLLRIHGFGFFG